MSTSGCFSNRDDHGRLAHVASLAALLACTERHVRHLVEEDGLGADGRDDEAA